MKRNTKRKTKPLQVHETPKNTANTSMNPQTTIQHQATNTVHILKTDLHITQEVIINLQVQIQVIVQIHPNRLLSCRKHMRLWI